MDELDHVIDTVAVDDGDQGLRCHLRQGGFSGGADLNMLQALGPRLRAAW